MNGRKPRRPSTKFIRATKEFPLEVKRIGLTAENEASLRRTFNRFAQLCHSTELARNEIEDCLLLLTTCRNEWYTLNAMYVEARQWCEEGDKYSGFGDALNILRRAISGAQEMDRGAKRAGQLLETPARYIEQFQRKHDLFFNRFDDIHHLLLRFAETIQDVPSRDEFRRFYAGIGSGPGPDHLLSSEILPKYETVRRRLMHWYAVARPLTGLARAFISEVLQIGNPHDKRCRDYLAEVNEGLMTWRSPYGYACPDAPDKEFFSWRWTSKDKGTDPNAEAARRVRQFVSHCDEVLGIARLFLREMLPLPPDRSVVRQFPLRKPGETTSIPVRGKSFQAVQNMFVVIMDMRNSSGDMYGAPELKAKISDIIDALCGDREAVSETTYNDCRVLGCLTLERAIQSVARLWHALEVDRSPTGFAGLRMGASRGDMLVGWRGPWSQDSILLDFTNSLSLASRLMDLDKRRWGTDKAEGQALVSQLNAWSADESLIFLDSSFYEALPELARNTCCNLGALDLRSFGKKLCWALPIPRLSQSLS